MPMKLSRMPYRPKEKVFVPSHDPLPPVPKKIRARAHSTDGLPKLPIEGISLNSVLESIERNFILQALARNNYSKTMAGQFLGIARTTLCYKMERLNILPYPPKRPKYYGTE
jgi:transcriptional regulator with PAS, ATPase and Fis domain